MFFTHNFTQSNQTERENKLFTIWGLLSGFSWLDSGYAGVSLTCVLLRISYLEARGVHLFLSAEVNFGLDMVLCLHSSCPCN